ncbi:hypothetical protein [Effusibacillus consociatus]|uniref:Uncharacterized protein n=1 Tax=Effusibacillus consociatus TaxID=1117041 RepID=A0ABV9QAH9_9BACL
MEEITSLDELTSFLESFLQDATVWCRLEWQKNENEQSIILTQFEGQFDFCDVVADEAGREIALEFLFHPSKEYEEPQVVSLPVDPDDVEVNILENALEIESLDFYLLLTIANGSPKS